MDFVDTHCHIQSAGLNAGERSTRELWAKAPEFSGDKLVANAVEAKVTTMVCVGCDLADSRLAVDFVADRKQCWASIGIHPHEAAVALERPDTLDTFAALADQPKVVAIGECGLDYFYEHSPRKQQRQVLEFQLRLAERAKLPVIFHVREALDDFWPIYDQFSGIRGVMHSFTDSIENLKAALDRGLYIGVNGIATFAKDEELTEMYRRIPLERLVLETDAPFLTPKPFRGKINEPKQIRTVAAYLAMLCEQPLEQLAQITTANARTLFGV